MQNAYRIGNKLMPYILYIAILLPLVVFYYYVYKYATNMPREDDYDAILVFLTKYKYADFQGRLSLLFTQHNEHRIVPSRIVYAIYYSITGQINFRHLILLNAGILTLLFLNISLFVKKAIPEYWQVCVLVTSMCVFDLSGFENMNFAMAGIQNFGVILAFTASLYFYGKNPKGFLVLALLLQCICTFSSGNGNLGSAIIVLYALFTKDKTKITVALATFLISAPLYYLHYIKPQTNFFTLDPFKFIPFFLHAAGAHFSLTYGISAGGLLFAILIAARPIGKRLSIAASRLPIVCLALFAIGSLGVMSLFRGNMPLWCSTASRYHIYSHLLTAIAFVFLVIEMKNERIVRSMMFTIVVGLFFFYNWNVKDGGYGMKAFRTELRSMNYHYPDSSRARVISEEACKEGIYCIEKHRADKIPAVFGSVEE